MLSLSGEPQWLVCEWNFPAHFLWGEDLLRFGLSIYTLSMLFYLFVLNKLRIIIINVKNIVCRCISLQCCKDFRRWLKIQATSISCKESIVQAYLCKWRSSGNERFIFSSGLSRGESIKQIPAQPNQTGLFKQPTTRHLRLLNTPLSFPLRAPLFSHSLYCMCTCMHSTCEENIWPNGWQL